MLLGGLRPPHHLKYRRVTDPARAIHNMPETILIVEDEPALRDTLTYNLKKDGFTVEAVGDGRTALESARHKASAKNVQLPFFDRPGSRRCP